METNLPVALTAFVGRKLELAEVGRLLFQDRIVTPCGPGGCGMTRLAVEVARLQLTEHPNGTSFVDLSRVTNPRLVVGAVATAAGLGAASVPRPDDLGQAAQRADGPAGTGQLRAPARRGWRRCRGTRSWLRILATSREPLATEGERVYRVAGLPAPDAVRLFVDRAQHADAAFRLDETNAGSVAAICERLDRLPLALELAAA